MGPAELLVKNHLNFDTCSRKPLSRKTIGFFCSPIGLGHASRDIAIAAFLEKSKIEFVTGFPASSLISGYGFSVRDVYRPPRFDVRDGRLQNSHRWLWQYYQYYKECKKAAESFIKKENPDIIVSDEDFASVSVAQQRGVPTVLITDILQTRFTGGIASLVEKRMNRSMSGMMQKCRSVIMPEEGVSEGNIRRVGPIVRHTDLSRDELREKFSFTKKTVLVSVGGTDAGRFLLQEMVKIATKINAETVFASGPSLQFDDKSVRNLGFIPNLHEAIYAADLVVSLAGKSTVDEAAAYGTPGIFIPIKNHFEQEDNARALGYSHGDISNLESLVARCLESPRSQIRTDGAYKAGKIINEAIPNT